MPPQCNHTWIIMRSRQVNEITRKDREAWGQLGNTNTVAIPTLAMHLRLSEHQCSWSFKGCHTQLEFQMIHAELADICASVNWTIDFCWRGWMENCRLNSICMQSDAGSVRIFYQPLELASRVKRCQGRFVHLHCLVWMEESVHSACSHISVWLALRTKCDHRH